jgi:hypothetical protein
MMMIDFNDRLLCKDAITGNVLELEGQTILIQTRSKDGHAKEVNAREMAGQMRSCISAKNVKFDSKSGTWYDKGVLVVARPGSGKTWMMQQIVHFMCGFYLSDTESAYKFVPVLFSVQRIARLYRTSAMNIGKKQITSQTDALHLLEAILKWEYDEATVRILLDCYNARTLVILLDGLDEASSLARIFETMGIFLAKSGNRVVMAARPEGIQDERFYTSNSSWTLLDLPELSVEQQKAIANHQIENIEGPFFDRFYAFQDCRNALDAAAEKCGIDTHEMEGVLSGINCAILKTTPEMMLSCSSLADLELLFSDDEEFSHEKKKVIAKTENLKVLHVMESLYERAMLSKSHFERVLDGLVGPLNCVAVTLKKPKSLLLKARRDGGFHNVTDIVKGNIICRDWTQLLITLKEIASSASMIAHEIHNGFKGPDFIRYRCLIITMSLEVSPQEGGSTFTHSVELQLHLKSLSEIPCDIPRNFFLEQDGLCGDEKQRMSDLKKCMDLVHAIGRTPVLLSVFLMYIKACTSKLSGEERDQTADVQTCPPMPSSLHYMYQEAMWGALETQVNNPSEFLEMLECVAFENMKHGES